MNKKIEALAKELDSVITRHDKTILELTAAREKSMKKLEEIKVARTAAMESGDLVKARKLKAEVIETESDVETYTVQIGKAEEDKSAQLKMMPARFQAEMDKQLGTEHDSLRAELIRLSRGIVKLVNEANVSIEEANRIMEILRSANGETPYMPQNYAKLDSIACGKKLLRDLYVASAKIVEMADGLPVYGMDNSTAQEWL